MQNRKLVVIGGDAAGMSAASKVRREHPDRSIVVFERGRFTSYAACGMPYLVAGMVEAPEQLIARSPETFREKQRIDVRTRHEVVEIDPARKRIRVRNLDASLEFWEDWDDLLIATGASPIEPDVPNRAAEGIFSLSTLQSGLDVFEDLQRRPPRSAVVVGGGYVGIEMAEALRERDIPVSLVDMAPTMLSAAGLEVPGLMQGLNQLPAWTGEVEQVRDIAICEHRHQPTALHLRTYIDDRYKMTFWRGTDAGELFDLFEDPDERRNLWHSSEHATLRSELMYKFIHAEIEREPTRLPRIAGA